jgi:hypoxanthine phosphoribosyltransferase
MPAMETQKQYSHRLQHNIVPLFTEEQIQTRIREMAGEINKVYQETDKLVIVSILKGGFMFASDLIRHLDVPCCIEFVKLSSYGNNTKSSGTVRPVDLSLPNLAGEDVLLVEDIIDTGLTMNFFMDYLQSLHKTKSLRLAALLDKPSCRNTDIPPVPIDFCGFSVGNEFLVGYGLDMAGIYRNLPYIGVVKEDAAAGPSAV